MIRTMFKKIIYDTICLPDRSIFNYLQAFLISCSEMTMFNSWNLI